MRVDYLDPMITGLAAGIGMMSAPGRDRSLDDDLEELRMAFPMFCPAP